MAQKNKDLDRMAKQLASKKSETVRVIVRVRSTSWQRPRLPMTACAPPGCRHWPPTPGPAAEPPYRTRCPTRDMDWTRCGPWRGVPMADAGCWSNSKSPVCRVCNCAGS